MALDQTIKCKLYSAIMLIGHGIYPIEDSHESRRHSWFSKSRAAPTAPEIRLGLGTGSTFCRGYSGTTFNIGSNSANLIDIYLAKLGLELYKSRYKSIYCNDTQSGSSRTLNLKS